MPVPPRLLVALACIAPALPAAATPILAPGFSPGDTWVYQDTTEKGAYGFAQRRLDLTIERIEGDAMTVTVKPDGAPGNGETQIAGLDWSKRHMVDGEMQTTTRPFSFPLRIGKDWTIDYQDSTRRGNQLSDHVHRTYTVIGWENVTVPSGTYRALKIVAKGTDSGQVEVPRTASGGAALTSLGGATFAATHRGGIRPLTVQTYAEIFYVPEVKAEVKSVEEQYNTDGVRLIRQTRELLSFKPAI